MKEIHVGGKCITPAPVLDAIAQIRTSGDQRPLILKISYAQKAEMEKLLSVVSVHISPVNALTAQTIMHDGLPETGQFCGLPYIIDPTVDPGEIQIEAIQTVESVYKIRGLHFTS